MIPLTLTLILIAFALVLIHAITQRVPLWIPVLLMCIVMMVPMVPLR